LIMILLQELGKFSLERCGGEKELKREGLKKGGGQNRPSLIRKKTKGGEGFRGQEWLLGFMVCR